MPRQIVTSNLGTFGEDKNPGAGAAGGEVTPTVTPEAQAVAAAEQEMVDTTLNAAMKSALTEDGSPPPTEPKTEHVEESTGDTTPPAPAETPAPEEKPIEELKPEEKLPTTWGAVDLKESISPPPTVVKKEFGGFATFAEYQTDVNRRLTASQTEAVRLYKQLQGQGGSPESPPLPTTLPPATPQVEQEAFKQLAVSHADVLDTATMNDYQKFVESGNNVFVFNNPKLYAMAKAMEKVSDRLPMADRLQAAFQLAFIDQISEVKVRQAQATAEIAATKAAKAGVIVSRGGTATKPTYTNDQQKWAQAMNVELP